MSISISTAERKAVAICVGLGAATSAALAPKDSYFLPNFLFFWGPQILILALALFFRPRAAVIAGIAFSLAGYLTLFGLWAFWKPGADGMVWVGYLFSLPGAALGVLAASVLPAGRSGLTALAAGIISSLIVAAGVAINQVLVCTTLMHCVGGT